MSIHRQNDKKNKNTTFGQNLAVGLEAESMSNHHTALSQKGHIQNAAVSPHTVSVGVVCSDIATADALSLRRSSRLVLSAPAVSRSSSVFGARCSFCR